MNRKVCFLFILFILQNSNIVETEDMNEKKKVKSD